MSILEELSKKDKEWRKAAYVICKDKMLADDLVQEMYFKLMNRTKWNDYFVFITLRNLFLDHLRKQKDIRIEELHYIEDRTEIFEPDDEEQKILDAFDKLDWVQKELLLERANGMSLRDIQKRYNINYGYTYRETTKAKEVILKNKKK
jgi:RNA polymerase sigma factor (sigma-70 family)